MIIFGTKSRVTRSKKNEDKLHKACPQCSNDLDLSELKRWFTLYFIPIFPFNHIDSFYYCKECKSSYKKEARTQLLGGIEGREAVKKETKKMFGTALITCLAYMSSVDGEISSEEDAIINKNIALFQENEVELLDIYKKIKRGKYTKDKVYQILREASKLLTTEGILMMIAEIARVILADGKIDPQEENLMHSFMLVCGISEDLYDTVLAKAKE